MTEFAQAPATIRIGTREVGRVGFGAMQLPGPMVWGEPRDPAAARAVLRRVVECGIRLIDTSWYYGPHVANRLIAETLYPYPQDLVLATKLGGARTSDKGWVAAISPAACSNTAASARTIHRRSKTARCSRRKRCAGSPATARSCAFSSPVMANRSISVERRVSFRRHCAAR